MPDGINVRNLPPTQAKSRPYICSVCGSSFSNQAGLTAHMARVHGEAVSPPSLAKPQTQAELWKATPPPSPLKAPPTDIPLWQKGLDWLFALPTATGMAFREMEEAWKRVPKQGAFESAWAYRERLESLDIDPSDPQVQADIRAGAGYPSLTKEYLPGGELHEEFRELPWLQQLKYEAPFWGAMTIAPGALQARAALAPAAAAPGLARVIPTAARTALAPLAGAEKLLGVGLKYGIGLPLKYGVAKPLVAGARKSLELALDTGLDKWLIRQGIRGDQANSVIRFFLEKNQRWLYQKAEANWLRRLAEKRGVQQTAQAAVDDTIREAEPLLLQAVKDARIKPPVVTTPEQLIQKAETTRIIARPIGELPAGVTERPVVFQPITLAGERGITYAPIEPLATNTQKVIAHRIAYNKQLISEAGKMKPQYRRLAQAITGKKSMTEMTQVEADTFTEALNRLVVKAGRPPKIPTGTNLITAEFADKIPLLNEIGLLEKVRPTRQVFEKMGLREEVWEPAFKAEVKIYEDKVAFRKEFNPIAKFAGRGSERDARLFDAIEDPKMIATLPSEERKTVEWGKKFFDKWADDLKLPPEKRRENYITHIFEEAVAKDLAAKHPLDPELVRAMDFVTPKTVFNPYLQKRLGQTLGLKRSFVDAINAYESRALRTFHYEPLIQRIRVYEKYLPPNAARYLRDFITRITNRPLTIDRELSQTLKEFGKAIEGLPGGKQLAEQLSKGNMGGLIAYNYASMLYFLWLGFKPTSAIRNLSQHFLALSEVGPIHFAKGLGLRATPEGQSALKESLVLRSRSQALLPGIDASFATRWTDKTREISLKMFRWADRQNVSDAFLSGYAEAKALGLPRSWCFKRGDEVAADTQYIYTRLGGGAWSQSALGRTLSPLTTWPENWLELVSRWTTGKISYVYRDYEKATGKKVTQMAWNTRRKALLLYLAIVGAAYGVEHKTPLRASEYTGWTSMRYLVDIARGELPALDLPGGVAQIIGGALTGNERIMKAGWNRVRPDRLMGIINQFRRIAEGKADWLSLFVYLNPEEEEKGAIPEPHPPSVPPRFPGGPKLPMPEFPTPRFPQIMAPGEFKQQIEDATWGQYPASLKKIADQIKELEKTDPVAARKLQFQYPQILAIRRQIALQQGQLKRQEAIRERQELLQGR